MALSGFLNIAKERGLTSHDVVNRVRRITRIKRAGHGGTLDPAAQGVLIVALGSACRLLRFLDDSKVYLAEILLGVQTTTDDLEGDVVGGDAANVPDASIIRSELMNFVGVIEQTPPAYSAIHVSGKRLYELARKGEVPEDLSIIPKRTVLVDKIDLLDIETQDNGNCTVAVRISCGGGTYIRSIARDLGARLGCGGTLKSLVREKAGPFEMTKAVTLDDLQSLSDLSSVLVDPINALAGMPVINLEMPDVQRLTRGQAIAIDKGAHLEGGTMESEMVLATHQTKLVAVCRNLKINDEESRLKPEVVLNDAV